jgi:hypothetical protein
MQSDSDQPGPASQGPTPEGQGGPGDELPFELETQTAAGRRPETAAEDETIERPVAELLLPPVVPVAARRLARWLLFMGAVSAALAGAAIVLGLLQGTHPVGWQGPFLAFCCAVVIFVVCHYVLEGMSLRAACRGVFCVAGLAVAGFVIQHSILRSAVRFIYGAPPPRLLTEFFVFGLLGLAGCVVFVECLRERSWAGRTASLALLVFLALAVFQPLTGYGLFGRTWAAEARSLSRAAWSLAVLAAAAAGLTVWLERARAAGARPRPRLAARRMSSAFGALWLLLLAAGAALTAYQLRAGHGLAGASGLLWRTAVACEVVALLPLVLGGMVLAWGRRRRLAADLCDATDFAWVLVALGGLACLIVWIFSYLTQDGLELMLVCAGILCAMIGAWLGATRGDWVSRWALAPTVALTVAVLCSLKGLVELARAGAAGPATPWVAAVAYLWCLVVVGLAFSSGGLAIRRLRARAQQPGAALWSDASLLCTAGAAISGLLLALLFGLAAGSPEVSRSLRAGLGEAWALGSDALTVAAGASFTRWAAGVLAAVGAPLAGRLGMGVLAGALLVVLVVHLLAASRVRWSFYGVAALWALPLGLGAAYSLLCASRLFFPLREPELVTAPGRFLGSQFAVRVGVLAFLAVVLARLAEALRSVVQLCRRRLPRRLSGAPEPAEAAYGLPFHQDRHLLFLLRMGIALSLAGLAVSLLLCLPPEAQGFLLAVRELGGRWLGAVVQRASRVGRLCAQWHGYAGSAAMVCFLLAAAHAEARQGRTAVYPLVSFVWVLGLVPHAFGLCRELRSLPRPAPLSAILVLAMAGALMAVFFAASLMLLVRWWQRARGRTPEAADQTDTADPLGAAQGLGSIGLAICLAGSLLVLHAALAGRPAYDQLFERAARGAAVLSREVAVSIEYLRARLELRRSVAMSSAALAALCAGVLALHLASRRRVSWARTALFVLWCLVALAGVALAGYEFGRQPVGTWQAGRIWGGLLLIVVLVRTLVAVANARRWLVERSA